MRKEIAHLWTVVEPTVTAPGFELVELEWTRDTAGWVLRVFIDRAFEPGPFLPGQQDEGESELFDRLSISHEDCERASRDLSAALDVADVIPHAYRLEVSSPGLDRPLRREKDFERFKGHEAKIRTSDAVEGRRNWSGTLRGAHDGVVTIETDGKPCQIPLDLVVRAHLVPDWAAEFRRAERSAT